MMLVGLAGRAPSSTSAVLRKRLRSPAPCCDRARSRRRSRVKAFARHVVPLVARGAIRAIVIAPFRSRARRRRTRVAENAGFGKIVLTA